MTVNLLKTPENISSLQDFETWSGARIPAGDLGSTVDKIKIDFLEEQVQEEYSRHDVAAKEPGQVLLDKNTMHFFPARTIGGVCYLSKTKHGTTGHQSIQAKVRVADLIFGNVGIGLMAGVGPKGRGSPIEGVLWPSGYWLTLGSTFPGAGHMIKARDMQKLFMAIRFCDGANGAFLGVSDSVLPVTIESNTWVDIRLEVINLEKAGHLIRALVFNTQSGLWDNVGELVIGKTDPRFSAEGSHGWALGTRSQGATPSIKDVLWQSYSP